jgi:hypothetical protein
MKLAPIVLFTYNRPQHTRGVLDSLAKNAEAKDSDLFIFSDGPKENAGLEVLQKIEETRKIIGSESRFKKVSVVIQEKNKGLAKSISDGVTQIVNEHGKVIVLEDDLILSPYFLAHMNDSLNRYEDDRRVAQIGACNFFACGPKFPSVFFLAMPECWGWATWRDRWQHFNWDAEYLLKQLQEKNLIFRFNTYGSYDMEGMLRDQIGKNGSSWAIRWQAVCILNNWLTLYPNPAFSNHIESDEATHASLNITPPLCNRLPEFKTVEIKELPETIEAMKLGYNHQCDYFGNPKQISFLSRVKSKFRRFVPESFIAAVRGKN